MSETSSEPTGPDLARGVPIDQLADGKHLAGHVDGTPVLLSQRGTQYFAIGATCTHYGGPLADGLVVGDSVRCPWHHACFSVCTGEALHAPALDPVARYRVEVKDGFVVVGEALEPIARPRHDSTLARVVIVGGGAAGNAAAEMLRREGYPGTITVLSADDAVPCDRPNLSKNYLAGTAPIEYTVLRPMEFYAELDIDLQLNTRATCIDTAARQVKTSNGGTVGYDALLLATGAEPVRLGIPGNDRPQVHYLRTLADGMALVDAVATARRAVVIGASFIGLEVAASLRTRGLSVDVVAPDDVPMKRVLGAEVGRFLQGLHERHGVTFHLGATVQTIGASDVTLSTGSVLPADLVVVGIGVKPALTLATDAGLKTDNGVVVDERLETSVPGIFAAGDIARWPDPHSGIPIRVEHWVVAERQGQAAARSILGGSDPYTAVPFFWTEHYDVALAYVGHAERWDEAILDGRLDENEHDCSVTYRQSGKTLAVATIFRDLTSLEAEAEFEATVRDKSAISNQARG